MSDDLVERLRALEAWIRKPTGEPYNINTDLFDDAADEIERLRAALEEIVGMEVYGFAITGPFGGDVECEGTTRFSRESDVVALRKIARAALAQGGDA